ncbi:MAG: tetratricopeptide repeat protein [Sedimentisphaerales bacterium]|nr:tetratricopeptide repeat protein [Sedimentisphaerales bacterium]
MDSNQVGTLIEQANTAFQNQDWQKALAYLEQASEIEPDHSEVLVGKGQCLINLGLAQKAIPIYEKIVNLMPNVPEVHNNLGVVYLITNNLIKAEMSFKEAIWLDENNSQAWKNLAQVYLQQEGKLAEGLQILSAVVQIDPNDTEALFQLALCYEIAGDFESAKTLLSKIIDIEPTHPLASRVLEDIKDATSFEGGRIARPEHIKKLSSLKSLIKEDGGSSFTTIRPQQPTKELTKKAALYSPDDFSGSERYPSIAAFYAKKGIKVVREQVFATQHYDEYDELIFYSPNLSGQLVNSVNQCIHNKKKYNVDMDIDLHNLPADHPAYTQFGGGNPNAIKVINIIIGEANMVTTASSVLAERLTPLSKHVELALPSWNPKDPWWSRPNPARDTLNIGWMGSKTDIPNLFFILPSLHKFFQENTSSVWFSVGSEEAYDMFPELTEDRRRYLPPPTSESIAYMLTNFDILLVPSISNTFNLAKSDLPLLYASIRGIPWVASPLPSFIEWKAGGIIAENNDDWYKILKKLSDDPALRHELGAAGKKKAEERKYLLS